MLCLLIALFNLELQQSWYNESTALELQSDLLHLTTVRQSEAKVDENFKITGMCLSTSEESEIAYATVASPCITFIQMNQGKLRN